MYENLDNRQLTELLVGLIESNMALMALLYLNVIDLQPGVLPEIAVRLRKSAAGSSSDVAKAMLESFASGLEEGRGPPRTHDFLRVIEGGKIEG